MIGLRVRALLRSNWISTEARTQKCSEGRAELISHRRYYDVLSVENTHIIHKKILVDFTHPISWMIRLVRCFYGTFQ